MNKQSESTGDELHQPSLTEAFRVFLRIGLLSFGGPAAQIALMHRMIVNENRWLSEKQYMHALSFCMLLPGPEAMQLATYAGWRLHGTLGGLLAGLLFVLPGAAVVLVLGILYVHFGNLSIMDALFMGIKAAVIVIVIQALLRVAKKALDRRSQWVIAILAFIAIFFFNVSFPLIVLAAGLFGFFSAKDSLATSNKLEDSGDSQSLASLSGKLPKTLLTITIWLALWVAPFFLLSLSSHTHFLQDVGAFFSRLAVVTFGGAYAVLAYLAQDIVVHFGWLTSGEMMDGLGLAETTPGPLILVTEFTGFVAGFKEGGMTLGLIAAALTLWVTFVPCFLWIFAGAPYLQWITEQPRLSQALSSITAAVVGVILNLSVWFALHVLFNRVTLIEKGPLNLWTPELASLNVPVLLLTIACAGMLFLLNWSVLRILTLSAFAGIMLMTIVSIS